MAILDLAETRKLKTKFEYLKNGERSPWSFHIQILNQNIFENLVSGNKKKYTCTFYPGHYSSSVLDIRILLSWHSPKMLKSTSRILLHWMLFSFLEGLMIKLLLLIISIIITAIVETFQIPWIWNNIIINKIFLVNLKEIYIIKWEDNLYVS